MIVYKARGASFEFDNQTKILTQSWKGFSASESFRAAIDKTVDFVKQNPVSAILNNTLEQGVVKTEDTEYASAAMPELFMNGLKAMAIILPVNVFTQLSMQKFENDTKGANVKMFTEISEARTWLKGII